MDRKIEALQPEALWSHFKQITLIPRPSYHEAKMREYLVAFAKQHNIECLVDEANNVYMHRPATKGMENRKGVIMQAHCDMVPQKNGDKVFNFETDAIDAYIDGQWVTADGTTLGADDGIGVAAALAIMEDNDLPHGEIEALFTATEETGMDGAFGLKPGLLKGDILLNLDSETEGELYVGCAGGLDLNATLPYNSVKLDPKDKVAFKLFLKGCKGGHSGIQIGYQRANANRLLCRTLLNTSIKYDVAEIDGGGLRNAIPREAFAIVVVDKADAQCLKTQIEKAEQTYIKEYAGIEDNISLTLTEVELPTCVIEPKVIAALIRAVVGCHDGVAKNSLAMENLVETSSNLARVVSADGVIKVQCLLRSSCSTAKAALGQAMKGVFELAGAKVELTGDYDGWQPNMNSPILHTMKQSYKNLFGVEPAVTAIHAGLECGIIGGKYPNLDMISFGPTICYPHSPDEKVNIESVGRFFHFLADIVKNAPLK